MSLKDRLDEDNADAWVPKEAGEELIGIIVDLASRTTDLGSYRIVTVKQEDGTRLAFHAYHQVAADQLRGAYAGLGEEIGIRYLGRKEGGAFGGYENYKIVVDHPPGWAPPEDAAGQQDREAQEAAPSQNTADESIPF